MLNKAVTGTSLWSWSFLRATRKGHTIVLPHHVAAAHRQPNRRTAMIKGGTVFGMLALATGSVICQIAWIDFAPAVQAGLGSAGAALGIILGARDGA